MKRLFVILLILCPWVTYSTLHAQLYRSSSATYHSYSTSGVLQTPSADFRSTSAYVQNQMVKSRIAYSTAPIRVANGTVTTVASTLQSGVLADEQDYAPVSRVPGRRNSNTMAPPTNTDPFVPIGDGWDVALLFFILCMGYIIYLKRKEKRVEIND